jgi:hypothetical protein
MRDMTLPENEEEEEGSNKAIQEMSEMEDRIENACYYLYPCSWLYARLFVHFVGRLGKEEKLNENFRRKEETQEISRPFLAKQPHTQLPLNYFVCVSLLLSTTQTRRKHTNRGNEAQSHKRKTLDKRRKTDTRDKRTDGNHKEAQAHRTRND